MEEEKDIKKTCESCIHNEDGLCDRMGYLVDDDELRCYGKYWKANEKEGTK